MQPRLAKPPGCAGCILERQGFGYAPADGPIGARLTFLAESLGGDEAIHGKPLIGAAGGVHSRVLARAGIAREQTRADNCCRCQPPGNWFDEKASWYYPALAHCAQYRAQTLAQVPDNGVVVTYGATALKTVLNLHGQDGINVRDWHGTVTRSLDDRYWIVPTFHPSHLQRGAMNLLEVVTSDLRLAQRIADRGYTRSPSTLVVDPPIEWFTAWVDTHLARLANDPDGTWLALDTEFPEKAKGQDESEIDRAAAASSPLLRYNVANSITEGVTVPASPAYATQVERLLVGVGSVDGWIWYWNKYADIDHLRAAGHTITGFNHIDLMWLCHYLQSDLPRGLGFWAPFASDFGAWKHWYAERFGPYAAADALQTYRLAVWAVKAAQDAGLWDVFYHDWHERDYYVLRPSRDVGVPADRAALEAFHLDLQTKQARILADIKQIGAQGTLRPKNGYAKRPSLGVCGHCNGTGTPLLSATEGTGHLTSQCEPCGGTGQIAPLPPASILGVQKGKRKSEAKQEYIAEGVTLVNRPVERDVLVCQSCGEVGARPTHKCRRPKGVRSRDFTLRADLHAQRQQVDCWFWAVPFNPSSWVQILGYIAAHGHTPGTSRKTRQPTTDAASLKKLAAETGDPLYQLLLDGRAVEKVDSTYAVGSLQRLDTDDRLHPEITPKPSTLRDSSSGPNLQNVVADKDTRKTLAAGFRKCIKSRDGLPSLVTPAMYDAWRARWEVTSDDTRCVLAELDFSGIEAILTGWCFWRHLGDSEGAKDYIRKCRLGLHAIVTALKLGRPINLNRPDDEIAPDIARIKSEYPYEYDIIKHVNHGTHYSLTPFGICQMFPEMFATPKAAEEIQRYLFVAAPSLPVWHTTLRKRAKEVGYLGGPTKPGAAPSIWDHPYGYRHWYWSILNYKPCDEVTARKWLGNPQWAGRIVVMHGRYFKIEWGEDAKRAASLYPQSIGAGVLKRAEMRLYHPDSPDFIGDAYFGLTPLLHPIHDSLLNHVPVVIRDRFIAICARVMQEEIPELPIPPEWGMGSYLRIGVEAKAGVTWDKDDMHKVAVEPIVYGVEHPEDSPVIAREPDEQDDWDALGRVVA